MTDTILIIAESTIVGTEREFDPDRDDDRAQGHHYLAKMAGLTWEQYAERTERRHLLWAQPVDPWPVAEARQAAQSIWPSLIGRHTILLGNRVSKAFSITWPPLAWAVLDTAGTVVAIVPRPTQKEPWWEDAANRAAARRFLGSLFGTDS